MWSALHMTTSCSALYRQNIIKGGAQCFKEKFFQKIKNFITHIDSDCSVGVSGNIFSESYEHLEFMNNGNIHFRKFFKKYSQIS